MQLSNLIALYAPARLNYIFWSKNIFVSACSVIEIPWSHKAM